MQYRPRQLLLMVLIVVFAAGSTGCLKLLTRKGTKRKTTKTTRPIPTQQPIGPVQELGTAAYPPGSPESGAALHSWVAKLTPNSYRVGYALAPTERASVTTSFQTYARAVGYTSSSDGRFRWTPPQSCKGDLHCPYENIAGRGSADLEPLIERFRMRQRSANLSAVDLAALIVTFVQNIRYEIPKDSPFGILPPPLVVAEQRGDCDSKSLLAHMLLRAFGIDSILVSSIAHTHAVLAIALPATGTKITYAGRQYYFTEMTAKASPIGHMNPSLLRPNDWRVVPVQYTPAPVTPPTPLPTPTPTPTPKPKPKR